MKTVFCSGVPITTTLTLTAAHCLPSDSQNGRRPSNIQLSTIDTNSQPMNFIIKRWRIHPNFKSTPQRGQEDFDLALIESDNLSPSAPHNREIPQNNRSGWFPSNQTSENLWLIGYSPTRLNLSAPHELLNSPMAWSQIDMKRRLIQEGKVLARARESERAAACAGDSGGPVWLVRANNLTLVGLVVQANCKKGEVKYVDLARYDEWIRQTTQQLSGALPNLWARWNTGPVGPFSIAHKIGLDRE